MSTRVESLDPPSADLDAGNPVAPTPSAPPLQTVSSESDATLRALHDARDEDVLGMKILAIDDEPYNILVVRKYLQDVGYNNFVATTEATEALNLIVEQQPDLVLLDILMPDVNGLEILQSLCEMGLLSRLPVLVLTAAVDPKTKHDVIRLGATDFLTKPIDPHDLLPRLGNALMSKAR